MVQAPEEKAVRATDAKEVGVGNPAEERSIARTVFVYAPSPESQYEV